MSRFKCTLWPSGEVLDFTGEDTLLNELKHAGKKVQSSCGGCATCGDCMVVVKTGEQNLSPQTFEELRLLGNVFHITKERLSCQAKVTGDITLDISHHDKKTEVKAKTVPKSTSVRLKKRQEVEKSARENEEKNQEKKSDTWYRHWEKDAGEDNRPKKLGGNKRPRAFKYNDTDPEEN